MRPSLYDLFTDILEEKNKVLVRYALGMGATCVFALICKRILDKKIEKQEDKTYYPSLAIIGFCTLLWGGIKYSRDGLISRGIVAGLVSSSAGIVTNELGKSGYDFFKKTYKMLPELKWPDSDTSSSPGKK